MGHHFNHKRVYRVYCRFGLNLPRRTKRVLPKRPLAPLQVVAQPNHQWALDFMHDTLYRGKRFRVLNVIDEGTWECLAGKLPLYSTDTIFGIGNAASKA